MTSSVSEPSFDPPPDWELIPLQHAAKSIETGKRDASFEPAQEENAILSLGGEHFSWTGEWKLDSPRYISEEMYRSLNQGKVEKGDCLLVKDGATIGKVAHADPVPGGRAAVNAHVYVLKPSEKLDDRFLAYLLWSQWVQEQIQLHVRGAAQAGLPSTFAGEVSVMVPPEEEQRSITSFLDHHTSRIDRLIEKKERLYKLLQEKRQAVITRTVTKGLDPDRTLVPQDSKWYDSIPQGWRLAPVKRIARVIDCKHRTAEYVEQGIPIVSPSEVDPGELDLERANRTTKEEYEDLIEGGRKPRRGDIIYSRNASLGEAALVRTEKDFCVGQDLCIVRAEVDGRFLCYALNSRPVLSQVEAVKVGSTFNRINVSMIKDLIVPVPGLEEQQEIGEHLDHRTHQFEKLGNYIDNAISLLEEKRQALITSAVIGQIDVTDWTPYRAQASGYQN